MRRQLSHDQEDALARMRDVLQDDFLTLEFTAYQCSEDFAEGTCTIMSTVTEQPSGTRFGVEASGVGMIDAFFKGLMQRYAPEHPSLQSIEFTSFSIKGLMGEGGANGTDAQAIAEMGVSNSYDTEFSFSAVSESVSRSSLEVVVAVVEYFVNSERAYVKMYNALEHYRSTGRNDLVAKYTDMLANMVRNTSYSSVIEKLQKG